jgi:hypothetical protein
MHRRASITSVVKTSEKGSCGKFSLSTSHFARWLRHFHMLVSKKLHIMRSASICIGEAPSRFRTRGEPGRQGRVPLLYPRLRLRQKHLFSFKKKQKGKRVFKGLFSAFSWRPLASDCCARPSTRSRLERSRFLRYSTSASTNFVVRCVCREGRKTGTQLSLRSG